MKLETGIISFYIVLGVYSILTWLINLMRFIHCDFEAPFWEEIIHGLGIILPPVAWFTAWI